MHLIDGPGATNDNLFTEGNPATGVAPTQVTAAWANMVQGELLAVLTAAGIEPDKLDNTQLAAAIVELIAGAVVAHDEDEAAHADIRTLIAGMGGATVDELFLGGGVLTESESGGATSVKNLLATNALSVVGMSFQGVTADTSAEFGIRLPSNWDHGTVKAKIHWSPAAGASAGDLVRFTLAAVAAGDDDAMDAALGAAVTIDDTVLAEGDMHITSASEALTIAGTPQAGDMLHFKLTRDYDYGAQHLDEAAVVWGITIQYGITGNISAW